MASRVAFFARLGVSVKQLMARIDEKGIEPRAELEAIAEANYNTLSQYPLSLNAATCQGAAHSIHSAVAAEQVRDVFEEPPSYPPRATAERTRPCCAAKVPGANSMTLLRSPFIRAASAFFYRGHSPNMDNYALRPGVFTQVGQPSWAVAKHRWSYRDFVEADEYRNIMTKMFGDPHGCPHAARCSGRGRCQALVDCLCYRNASAYLGMRHVDAATKVLERHRFIGMLEAYNASVRLLLHTFRITPERRDFLAQRSSTYVNNPCLSGNAALRLDAKACRGTFRANELDFVLYERVHREFCRRLRRAGLEHEPMVQRDLERARLCSVGFRFDDVDAVCGPLEADTSELDSLRHRCPHVIVQRWKWGFEGDFSSPGGGG